MLAVWPQSGREQFPATSEKPVVLPARAEGDDAVVLEAPGALPALQAARRDRAQLAAAPEEPSLPGRGKKFSNVKHLRRRNRVVIEVVVVLAVDHRVVVAVEVARDLKRVGCIFPDAFFYLRDEPAVADRRDLEEPVVALFDVRQERVRLLSQVPGEVELVTDVVVEPLPRDRADLVLAFVFAQFEVGHDRRDDAHTDRHASCARDNQSLHGRKGLAQKLNRTAGGAQNYDG